MSSNQDSTPSPSPATESEKEKAPKENARGRGRPPTSRTPNPKRTPGRRRPMLKVEPSSRSKTPTSEAKEILSPNGKPYTPKEKLAASTIQKFFRTNRRRSVVKKLLSPNSVKLKTKLRRGESAPTRPSRDHPISTKSMTFLGSVLEGKE
mmetsp:Transcript_33319/g.53745  ORF Transcript_33319/g.53745 Transcript_33319/m.53745 type:complete len:150 (-) Transcript_33319:678-1127(-)|eukprot:jgi/Bigna1/89997/estExt_fgenesh1_pg.C_600007